jgi:hypothetical protein
MRTQRKRRTARRQVKGHPSFYQPDSRRRGDPKNRSTDLLFRKSARQMIGQLYQGVLHHKQLESLRLIVMGVLFSSVLGIAAVGRAMGRHFGTEKKHGIKQVDRHLSQPKVELSTYYRRTVQMLVGVKQAIQASLDWTDFDGDKCTTLVAALIWKGKRTPPLVWMTVKKSTLKGKQKDYEKQVLLHLKAVLPAKVRVTIVADRGFGDVALFEFIQRIGFDFVIRFRQGIYVGYHKKWLIPASMLVPRNGHVLVIRDEVLTAKEKGPYTVVLTKAKGMKEPWCLATNLDVDYGRDIVHIYSRRFQCEETFRDLKDHRYGYGFNLTSMGKPRRRDQMILLFTLAYILLLLFGVASERLGLDKYLRANTVKRRTHSLFQQGIALTGRVAAATYKHLAECIATLLNDLFLYGADYVSP